MKRFSKLQVPAGTEPTSAAQIRAAAAETPRVAKLKKQIADLEQSIRKARRDPQSKPNNQKRLRNQLKQLNKQLAQAKKGGNGGGGGAKLGDELVMAVGEAPRIANRRINIKGDPKNLGEECPRRPRSPPPPRLGYTNFARFFERAA